MVEEEDDEADTDPMADKMIKAKKGKTGGTKGNRTKGKGKAK